MRWPWRKPTPKSSCCMGWTDEPQPWGCMVGAVDSDTEYDAEMAASGWDKVGPGHWHAMRNLSIPIRGSS